MTINDKRHGLSRCQVLMPGGFGAGVAGMNRLPLLTNSVWIPKCQAASTAAK
jgi:hypothetical protein